MLFAKFAWIYNPLDYIGFSYFEHSEANKLIQPIVSKANNNL